jgi:hypothetical protein
MGLPSLINIALRVTDDPLTTVGTLRLFLLSNKRATDSILKIGY